MQAVLDQDEVAKFARLAASWWDPTGPMAPLHRMNPWRIRTVVEAICRHAGRDPRAQHALAGLSLLDVGCGAGLFCEPMARLGADVTGIDPAAETIEAARAHALAGQLTIDYRAGSIDALLAETRRFDVVTALEVVEHTSDPDGFVDAAAASVADGGLLILSTIARTNKAWLEAVVAAEYLLSWLPRGTHDWRRFLKASELARMVRRAGLTVVAIKGMTYDARSGGFVDAPRPDVNYLLVAAKPRTLEEPAGQPPARRKATTRRRRKD